MASGGSAEVAMDAEGPSLAFTEGPLQQQGMCRVQQRTRTPGRACSRAQWQGRGLLLPPNCSSPTPTLQAAPGTGRGGWHRSGSVESPCLQNGAAALEWESGWEGARAAPALERSRNLVSGVVIVHLFPLTDTRIPGMISFPH